MGEKLIVGPFGKGLKQNLIPIFIDNDSFPKLQNAYQWRGRVKRKRGTTFLNRCKRYFESLSRSYNPNATTITLAAVTGAGNLITGFTLESTSNIVPGTVTITAPGPTLYTDPAMDGTLSPSGTINYASGAIAIPAQAGNAVSAIFNYYPGLPSLGAENFVNPSAQFPNNIAFDTKYSYNMQNSNPYAIYDVSFYKNPVSGAFTGYTEKTVVTKTSWNGQSYQQFWSTNYSGSLWVTNGFTTPFTTVNIGMQFKPIITVTVTAGGPPAQVTLEITSHGLEIGDFLFINEVDTTTGINFQTGYVTAVTDGHNVVVDFPNATIATNGTGGIAQYLTNRSDVTKDCIRWYDGNPTDGDPDEPVLNGHRGWVNFMPPLSHLDFSISGLPQGKYYLVGCLMILPFKDRLLFIGPVVQTSSGNAIYLKDTVVYSQVGTPYYTASFTGEPDDPTINFTQILTPFNGTSSSVTQTASPAAYFADVTGFGGFVVVGLDQAIMTTSSNQDVLIMGLRTNFQVRLVYTGNDVIPFNFYVINSELGSDSTFAAINMDDGVITKGNRGYILTSQDQSQRLDVEIPDQVFQVNLLNNGSQRFTAERDFINEWIYFTYLSVDNSNYIFPNETLQYNYRDQSYAIFKECYTTYGQLRKTTGDTWRTLPYKSWREWTTPWTAGSTTLLQPKVIGGNQQGFFVFRDEGTSESKSLFIKDFTDNTVTCPNHCLNNGDFIIIADCIGTVGWQVNNRVFQISSPVSQNAFTLGPEITTGYTYFGGGTITRLYVPEIKTKQFPLGWSLARKTRIGTQQYLLTSTKVGQITLQMFLSQDTDSPYNEGPIVPDPNSQNNSLIYSSILYTCPESTNLGLLPASANMQNQLNSNMLQLNGLTENNSNVNNTQSQIWHRKNTSLIGDTVQLGFTISSDQMSMLVASGVFYTIEGITQANPAVITVDTDDDLSLLLPVGSLILLENVGGMVEVNDKVYLVLEVGTDTVTIGVDSSAFTEYTEGGEFQTCSYSMHSSELELHGFIIDVNQSQVLA